MSTNNQGLPFPSAENVVNILTLALRGWALSVEVWLRSGFGSRYIGLQGLCVVGLIPLYAMLWEGCDLRPLFCFLGCFLGLVLFRRAQTRWRTRHGEKNHSRYSGQPDLWPAFPRSPELTIKQWVEPIFTALTGFVICIFDQPLGVYLIIAAVLLRLSVDESEQWARARAQEMNDAVFEQQDAAERFRDLRGDYF